MSCVHDFIIDLDHSLGIGVYAFYNGHNSQIFESASVMHLHKLSPNVLLLVYKILNYFNAWLCVL